MNKHEQSPQFSKESAKSLEAGAEAAQKRLEELRKKYEKGVENNSETDSLDALVERAEALASDTTESSLTTESSPVVPVQAQKDQAYAESLSAARSSLSGYQKRVSKIIHTPIVEKTSEVLNQTVLRPSVFTGAMVVSAIGTIALYVMSKHYGYAMNSVWTLILLFCGALAGIIAELLLRTLSKK